MTQRVFCRGPGIAEPIVFRHNDRVETVWRTPASRANEVFMAQQTKFVFVTGGVV